ncbi:MAG: anthranilate synthase component I [Balneolaceae bacterium]
MNQSEFEKLAKDYSAIPVARRCMADTLTPVSIFLSLREGARYPFLLESVEGGEQVARYSFLGRDPFQILRFTKGQVTLERDGELEKLNTPYFEALRELTTRYREPELPDLPLLTGGAVGYSSYDTVREIENLPDKNPDEIGLPDAIWAFYDEIVAFDHVKKQLVLIKTVFPEEYGSSDEAYQAAESALEHLENCLYSGQSRSEELKLDVTTLKSNTSKERFLEMVNKARKYIYEGDIFQVVLSQRFELPFEGDRFMLYRALRMVNPSPYLFFLEFDHFSLVGSSPEVLVRVQKDKVQLLPIAGTRPRGSNREEDLQLEEDLKRDPKEIAEHIMLVDLGRNDLSRVCRPGTVHLERNQVIERYSHVMHIVSDVIGELSPDMDSVDSLKYCFPAGTVSGAPKIRAMEIIDELEPSRRGVYAGAVGYFDYSGNMDTCIAIRTMVVTDQKVYIQAGAGIVADSVPEREYDETRNKAGALIEALRIALSLNRNRRV